MYIICARNHPQVFFCGKRWRIFPNSPSPRWPSRGTRPFSQTSLLNLVHWWYALHNITIELHSPCKKCKQMWFSSSGQRNHHGRCLSLVHSQETDSNLRAGFFGPKRGCMMILRLIATIVPKCSKYQPKSTATGVTETNFAISFWGLPGCTTWCLRICCLQLQT